MSVYASGASDREGRGFLNKVRFWFTRSSSDSRKAHILGVCQPRGSTTYDNFASKALVRLAENMYPFSVGQPPYRGWCYGGSSWCLRIGFKVTKIRRGRTGAKGRPRYLNGCL